MRVLCNYLMSSTVSLPNSPLSSSLGSLCGLALTGALLLLEGLQLGDGSEAGSTEKQRERAVGLAGGLMGLAVAGVC